MENRGNIVDRTGFIEDFKKFLRDNDDLVRKHTVKIEDLPPDDDWILDNEWDEIYRQEVFNKKNAGI